MGLAGGWLGVLVRPLLEGLGVGLRIAGPREPLARPELVLAALGRATLGGDGVSPRGGGRELRSAGTPFDDSRRRAPLPRPGGIERVR